MILKYEYMGDTFTYEQEDLPWYKRMLGMKYGPVWKVALVTAEGKKISVSVDDGPPNPALIIGITLKCLEQAGVDHEI